MANRIGAAHRSIVELDDDLIAGGLGERMDRRELPLVGILVRSDIGLAGGPQVGDSLDQSLARHGALTEFLSLILNRPAEKRERTRGSARWTSPSAKRLSTCRAAPSTR